MTSLGGENGAAVSRHGQGQGHVKTKEKSKTEQRACTLFPGPISPPNPLLLRVPPEPDDIYQPRGCSTGNEFPARRTSAQRSFVERTFAAHFCALAKRKRASPPHERGTAPPAEKQAPRRSAPPRKNREEQRGHPAEPGAPSFFCGVAQLWRGGPARSVGPMMSRRGSPPVSVEAPGPRAQEHLRPAPTSTMRYASSVLQ